MNIKTFLWIAQGFFEQIHPNIYSDEEDADSEIDKEIIDDVQNDYFYLKYCCQGLIMFINSNFESIKSD
jgi:hypothetical protein